MTDPRPYAHNSTFRVREHGITRTRPPVPLNDDGSPRRSSLPSRKPPLVLAAGAGAPVVPVRQERQRREGIRPVSGKRRRENRERAAMINALYPERPPCGRPGCPRMADDIHEPLTRARGGSIVDPDNQVPLCRPCHDEVTFRPESELGWAYDCGLLVHSWDGPVLLRTDDGSEVTVSPLADGTYSYVAPDGAAS